MLVVFFNGKSEYLCFRHIWWCCGYEKPGLHYILHSELLEFEEFPRKKRLHLWCEIKLFLICIEFARRLVGWYSNFNEIVLKFNYFNRGHFEIKLYSTNKLCKYLNNQIACQSDSVWILIWFPKNVSKIEIYIKCGDGKNIRQWSHWIQK